MAEGASTGPTDEETRMFLEAASAGHDVLVQRMLMSPNKVVRERAVGRGRGALVVVERLVEVAALVIVLREHKDERKQEHG